MKSMFTHMDTDMWEILKICAVVIMVYDDKIIHILYIRLVDADDAHCSSPHFMNDEGES